MLFKKEKDYDYFDFFVKIAENACQASQQLHKSLLSFDRNQISERVAEMHEIEHRADIEKHNMTERLIHEFLPPIEREDIASLAHQLDNVVDSIDDVMLRIDMYNVSTIITDAIILYRSYYKVRGECLTP